MNSLKGMKYDLKMTKKMFTKEYVKTFKEGFDSSVSYDQMMHKVYNEPKPSRFTTLRFIKELLKSYISSLTCVFLDHDMECTSSAGPESGSESGYCKRCGYSFDVIMY